MTKKTSCGGLKIDNETIVETNGVLKVKGGSSVGNVLVVEYIQGDENDYIDATAKELIDALGEGKLVFIKHYDGGPGRPVNTYERRFISNAFQLTLTGEVVFTSISAFDKEVNVNKWKAATENDKPIADYGE